MFKLIEKKGFFYFCAVMSIILTITPLIFVRPAMTFSIVFETLVMVIIPICMILFFNYKHKELMKVLLTAFLTSAVFVNNSNVSVVTGYIFSTFANSAMLQDGIRRWYSVVKTEGTVILLTLIFINHFVVNYNGNASKVIININKLAVVLLVILVITDKISILIVNFLNPGAIMEIPVMVRGLLLTNSINSVFYALTAVSAEAFINAQRAAKNIDK